MEAYIGISIASMIKKYLLPIFILSSCAFVEYNQLPALTYRAIVGADDIVIDEDFLAKQKFSFVKVRMGKQSIAIMTLANIAEDTYRWVSASGEIIVTNKGRIIETTGLPYDIKQISYTPLSNNTVESFVYLANPEAIINKLISIDKDVDNKFVEEKFLVKKIKWKGRNIYEYNDRNLIVYTKQSIHPRLPDIEMIFYY
jgi:hypothetical protein